MEIKEMDNETLMRNYICTKRQMKTIQSEIKQYETELDNRFDNQKLVKEN